MNDNRFPARLEKYCLALQSIVESSDAPQTLPMLGEAYARATGLYISAGHAFQAMHYLAGHGYAQQDARRRWFAGPRPELVSACLAASYVTVEAGDGSELDVYLVVSDGRLAITVVSIIDNDVYFPLLAGNVLASDPEAIEALHEELATGVLESAYASRTLGALGRQDGDAFKEAIRPHLARWLTEVMDAAEHEIERMRTAAPIDSGASDNGCVGGVDGEGPSDPEQKLACGGGSTDPPEGESVFGEAVQDEDGNGRRSCE